MLENVLCCVCVCLARVMKEWELCGCRHCLCAHVGFFPDLSEPGHCVPGVFNLWCLVQGIGRSGHMELKQVYPYGEKIHGDK